MQPSSRNSPARALRVVQVGCGAWGANVLRELASHPRVVPVAVVDPREAARDNAHVIAPHARVVDSFHAVAGDDVDAAVIVTPGAAHAELAELALHRGLHVFVEKPMTKSSVDAARLCATARSTGRVGMVGHLLHHHPAALAMLATLRTGELGVPLRVRCDRHSIAGSRDVDGSILWSLAPHDLSMILAIAGAPLELRHVDVLRTGTSGQPLEADLHLQAAGISARVCLSRVADRKMRRIHVECELGSIMFDDVVSSSKVVVASRRDGAERVEPVAYDVRVSPLAAEVDSFVRAVLDGTPAHADFEDGFAVVRTIEAAEAMCRASEGMRCPASAT